MNNIRCASDTKDECIHFKDCRLNIDFNHPCSAYENVGTHDHHSQKDESVVKMLKTLESGEPLHRVKKKHPPKKKNFKDPKPKSKSEEPKKKKGK